jgi:hypothetical protein
MFMIVTEILDISIMTMNNASIGKSHQDWTEIWGWETAEEYTVF